MTFRTFDNGIRVAKGFPTDPATGKVGELYWNTARLVLRQCTVGGVTPSWEDVTVKPGTTQFATLYWDIVNNRWTQNVLLLTDGRKIYAANSATPLPLELQAGDTTNPGEFGSDVVIRPGVGALGQGSVIVDAEQVVQPADVGTALNITAGDSTVNAAGNDLNLNAGTGTSELGNVNVNGQDVNLIAADKIRLNGEVVFSQILVADPVSVAETAQLYWHDTFKRFRAYDGTQWYWIDVNRYNSPIVIVDLFDDAILSLPATTATLVDGTTVTDGMLVVMQNSGSPVIYQAAVAGVAITWNIIPFGQSPTVNPSIGDSIYVRNGVDNIDTFMFFQSTGTWIDPSGSTNAPITAGVAVDNTIRWDGTTWVPDVEVLQNGFGAVYRKDNTAIDAAKAESLFLRGSAKTGVGSTGDGGDVTLQGGTSVGGRQGDVVAQGNMLIVPNAAVAPAYRNYGIFFDAARGKFRGASNSKYDDLDGANLNGEITGFLSLAQSTISFVDGTRTFSLSQTNILNPIEVYLQGRYFVFVDPTTVVIPNTIGNHYIYVDTNGALVSNTVYDMSLRLKDTVLVAIVNWNGTASTLVADRRVLLTMDGDNRFHQRNISPIDVKPGDLNITSGGNYDGFGNTNVATSAGNAYIEELVRAIPTRNQSSSQIPLFYLSSTNVMNEVIITEAARNNGVNLLYNLNTAGTWSQAIVPSNQAPDFARRAFNVWVAVTTDPTRPVVLFQGQQTYASVTDAQAELPQSVVSFWPASEYKIIHRITYLNSAGLSYGPRLKFSLFDFAPMYADVAELILAHNTQRDVFDASAANQDMYFNPVTGDVTWTQNINFPVTNLQNSSNTLPPGTVNLSDFNYAVMNLNKRAESASTLSLSVQGAFGLAVPGNLNNKDQVMVFKRLNGEVYFMAGKARRLPKRIPLADNVAAFTSIFNFPNSTSPNYRYRVNYSIYRNGTIESGTIDVVRGAIGNVGFSISGASNGASGVTLQVAESGSTLQLQYTSTNTGQIPTIRYDLEYWLTT